MRISVRSAIGDILQCPFKGMLEITKVSLGIPSASASANVPTLIGITARFPKKGLNLVQAVPTNSVGAGS
jgi:hypothetical protein